VSSIKLAEYSFAWKLFEAATLPLLIIAPIMIPLFTRLFKQPGHEADISFFLEWQIITACFIGLLLNMGWAPAIDLITDGKYGLVNNNTIFILSFGMPLLYFNNYLWTINFAKGKLRMIFFIIAVGFAVNITACCVLIPLFQNEGAATAYLLSLLVQTVFYIRKTDFLMTGLQKWTLLTWPIVAFVCGFAAREYLTGTVTMIVVPGAIYVFAVFLSKKIKGKDWKALQALYQ
jgi:O-antigen/teichoic acid export membrane protein